MGFAGVILCWVFILFPRDDVDARARIAAEAAGLIGAVLVIIDLIMKLKLL